MSVDMDTKLRVWQLRAKELGEDAGRAAGSWAADGNTDKESAAKVLWMIRGGDPAAVDYLPREPNLSGEMAGDPTPQTITEEIAGEPAKPITMQDQMGPRQYDDAERAELQDALSDAWEEGVSETFELACERELMAVAEPDRAAEEAEFLRGYMECALWSSADEDENQLDDKHDISDISAELKVRMSQDCAAFIRTVSWETLDRFSEVTGRDYASHGHDFWLTRNGHGAGFWDRYLEVATTADRKRAENLGEAISVDARAAGEFNINAYDGRIEQM